MYKTKLQEFCHQRRWNLPNYTSTRAGPDHDPRFRASVLVNGVTFDSPDSTKTAKGAQNEAAQVAYNHLTANQQPQPESPTPVQSAVHSPSLPPSPSGEARLFLNADAQEEDGFENCLTDDLQKNLNLEDADVDREVAPEEVLCNDEVKPETQGSSSLKNISGHLAAPDRICSNGGTAKVGHSTSSLKQENAAGPEIKGSTSLKNVSEQLHDPVPPVPSSEEEGSSSPKTVLEHSDHAIAEQNAEKPAQDCAMSCNRVVVFPRKQGWTLPEGATLLPISDDKWVAVSFDCTS